MRKYHILIFLALMQCTKKSKQPDSILPKWDPKNLIGEWTLYDINSNNNYYEIIIFSDEKLFWRIDPTTPNYFIDSALVFNSKKITRYDFTSYYVFPINIDHICLLSPEREILFFKHTEDFDQARLEEHKISAINQNLIKGEWLLDSSEVEPIIIINDCVEFLPQAIIKYLDNQEVKFYSCDSVKKCGKITYKVFGNNIDLLVRDLIIEFQIKSIDKENLVLELYYPNQEINCEKDLFKLDSVYIDLHFSRIK